MQISHNRSAVLSCFRKAHGYSRDTAHDLGVARVNKPPDFTLRVRIRNSQQVAFANLTPTANVFPPQLDEVDRPFVLVLPFYRRYFLLACIDLHDRARPKDGVHREIRHSDQSVNALAEIEMLDQANRHLSPDFYEPRQQIGSVEFEVRLGPQWDNNRFAFRLLRWCNEIRLGRREHRLIPPKVTYSQTKKRKDARPMCPVDRPEEIIWTMNAETKEVVYVNQAYVTITGHSIQSLSGSPSSYRELIHPQDRIRVLSKLQEVVTTGFFDEEFRFIHANGTVRWIWVKAHPARDARGRWLVGTAQDITSRKEAEKQIAEHLDATEAARAEAEALRKATLALSQNLAMDSVLDTLLQCIGELVPFDRASVLFVEDPTHLMVARETTRSALNRAGLVVSALENPLLQRILFEHKPVLLSDTEKEIDWKNYPPFESPRSWMGIPLRAAGTVIGILSLGTNTPGGFTTEHLRLAKNLAVSAAVAIQNARIHERAEIYGAELELRLEELREAHKALTARSESAF